MFGRTLMLAGFTRILEVIFFVPSYASDQTDDDTTSEHTLAEGANPRVISSKASASRSFRYLTPFVSTESTYCRVMSQGTTSATGSRWVCRISITVFADSNYSSVCSSCLRLTKSLNMSRTTRWTTSHTF